MIVLAYGRRLVNLYSQKLLHIFLVVNLIFTSITEVRCQSWVEKPKDRNVTVGATVRFPCEAQGVTGSTQIWNKGTSPIFVNGQRNQGVPDRYQIQGNNTLVISNVELGDDSYYSCNIFGFDSIEVRLTVLLPPGQPTIQINSSSPFVEQSVISLTCSSTGGKPTPTVRWLRNGQPITSAILTPPTSEMGTTSSQIVVELTRQDNSANYSCVVFNDANVNNPLVNTRILNVQYSPSVRLEPDFSPYYVKLNSRVELRCRVDANPPVPGSSIQWYKEGSPYRGSTSTLSFISIQKADSGNYTCIASNTIRGVQNTAQASRIVDVIYAPTVTTQSVITANISDQVNMTCIVDANPNAQEIRWAKVDNSIYANGPNFVFIAQKRYAGNYSCTAFSQLQPSGGPSEDISSTGYTSVNIQYAPGQASIDPVQPVLVDRPLILTCRVDDPGFPLPTIYDWRKNGTSTILQTSSSPMYRKERAALTDNGEYTCQPRNIIGQGSVARIPVEVNSLPEFVQSLPSSAILTIPVSQSKLRIQHEVEGRPAPIVEWYKDGMPVTLMPNLYTVETTNTTADTYKTRVTTALNFIGSERDRDRLQINDTGNYTCQVMSAVDAERRSRSTYLSVEFPPTASTDQRIATNVGETARIICRVQANPTPMIYWYKQGQRLHNSSRVSMYMTVTTGISKYEGVLRITNTALSDFGEYVCEVNNSKGFMRQQTMLSPRDKPDAPVNLAAVEKTWESVKLRWDPGFNGGYEQTFHVVMKSVHGEKTEPVFPPNANSFNVSRLMPHTSYTFNVYGKNKLGIGGYSTGFTTQTEVLVFPPLKEIPEFDVADQQLTIPNDLTQSYCLRVEVSTDSGKVWTVIEPCIPTSEGGLPLNQPSATNVNISVCLVYRPEVCGEPVLATIHQEDTPDLTKEQVIIIGVVCAAILTILLVILIIIICRRMRNNKNYNNDTHSPRAVQQGNGTLQNSKPRSFDTQDIGPPLDSRNGYPAPGPQYMGQPMGDMSYDSHMYDKHYEYEMNRRNANMNGDGYYGDKPGDLSFNSGSPRTPTKDPQQFINLPEENQKNEGGSFGSGNESGYSTPDPAKPKKGWRLNTSLIPWGAGRTTRSRHMKTNPDIVPYSHDPPGHTCGLPCCSEDLQIQLRVHKPPRSCIGFQDFDAIQQNFTFRGRLKPQQLASLESGFFSVQAPKEPKRGTIPKFGSVSVGGLKRIAEDQKQINFLKGREITLPESKDPNAVEKLYLEDFNVGESEDVFVLPDDEIEYYLSVRKSTAAGDDKGVPYNPGDLHKPSIYPWDMLKDMKQDNENTDKTDDSSSSNYYEILRYPDEITKPGITFQHVKQITIPVPPKLPAQTIYNHPPLGQVSSPALCRDYLNQVSKTNNNQQLHKYNTYSSVYSYYTPEITNRNPYEHYLSLDRAIIGPRSFRPDVRDINFLNLKKQSGDIQKANANVSKESESTDDICDVIGKPRNSSLIKAGVTRLCNNTGDTKQSGNALDLPGIDKTSVNLTKELKSKLQFKSENSHIVDDKEELIDRNNDDDDDDTELGITNPAFKHVNIDGKIHSTRTLNIDGKLRGTHSLDYRHDIQGFIQGMRGMDQISDKSKSLDYRSRSTGSRILDIDGNAVETKSLELLDKVGKNKLISLLEDDEQTAAHDDEDNPITLIL